MKKKNRFWISQLVVIGFVIILTNSCKKSDETNTSVTDKDGNVYKTVTIGTQVWMDENLKTTKYQNGDLIGTTTPATKVITSEISPKYQWAYDGIESNVATYGRLYTWYAVTDSRKVCPTGFHLPSDGEWTILTTYLGGVNVAGGKLKETGTVHWLTPNTGATNETGFSALPSGARDNLGFWQKGTHGYWWCSTEYTTVYAWSFFLYNEFSYSGRGSNNHKTLALSVRCIKDN